MSNIVVKEKKQRKSKKTGIEETPELTPRTPKFTYIPTPEEDLVDILPLEKKVRKVKKKPTVQELQEQSLSEQNDIPAVEPAVEPAVQPVVQPVVEHVIELVVSEVPSPIIESELELFKQLSKKIYKEKRQAKLKALTPEELEAKREIARQKNKEYREKNKDKIREKDKKYASDKAQVIKEKRVAKLQDPEAKAAYNEQQRLYKAKARAQAKAQAQAGAEPKPPKVAKMTKAQQRDLILNHEELTAEEKLIQIAALIK